jgi:hypothetical protein
MAVVDFITRRRYTRTPVALGCTLAVLVLFFHAKLLSRSKVSSFNLMEDINNATFGVSRLMREHRAPLLLLLSN